MVKQILHLLLRRDYGEKPARSKEKSQIPIEDYQVDASGTLHSLYNKTSRNEKICSLH